MSYIILLSVGTTLMTKRGADDLTRSGENKRACCSGEAATESSTLGMLALPLFCFCTYTLQLYLSTYNCIVSCLFVYL